MKPPICEKKNTAGRHMTDGEGREGITKGKREVRQERAMRLPKHPSFIIFILSHPPPHHSLPWMRRRRSRTRKRAGREGGSGMPSPGVAQRVPLLPRHLLLATNVSANFSRGTLDSLSPSTPHLPWRRAFPGCYSSRMTLEQLPSTSMPP